MKAAVELAGGTAELTGAYPGWRPNMNSKILATARSVEEANRQGSPGDCNSRWA